MKDRRILSSWVLLFALAATLPGSAKAQQNDRPDDGDRILAVVNGRRVITQSEVDGMIGSQLLSLKEKIYALRKDALESLITRSVIEEEARASGKTVEDFISRLVPEQVSINHSQIDQFYAESANRLAGISEDEVRQRIRLELENREKIGRYRASIAELRKKARVETFLAAPVSAAINIATDGPARGPSEAPVTIIEFSDFQCPYCKQATKTVEEVIRAYGDSVRVVFKHLPLPMHADAFKAAQAAVCADRQGKFWQYHDRLFNSSDLKTDSLKKHGAELGLNTSEFDSCLESDSSRAVVLKNMQQARQADIQGTPTFLINGRLLRGARSIDDFRKAIDELLKDSNVPQSKQL